MKKKLSVLCSLLMGLQMILSTAVIPVFAEDEDSVGNTYTVPETVHQTFNMNVDWKFYEADNTMNIPVRTAWESAAKGGKQFYEKDYDDSAWETVSIPHAVNAIDSFISNTSDDGGGKGRMGVFLYRKTFTLPEMPADGKVIFELEGIRQAAYVWVNGKPVGYYEAGITSMGFDITTFVEKGQNVIAICNDASAAKGNPNRVMHETVPGEPWGSSYSPNNKSGTSPVGNGAGYEWNTRDFNEVQAGLVYDAYLYITGSVYQTFPLYNNLKTTGNYIYASDFDIDEGKAKINVKAEVRNESNADGNYTLEVAVVDHEGKLKYNFNSASTAVKKASDAGVVYETAVEKAVYDDTNITNPVGITEVKTPDVTYIEASYNADNVRFWSLEDPYLYTVYTILKDASGNAVDVQSKKTGFRKVTYDKDRGVMINDSAVWMTGYAQRSTNEWAVVGIATDWLQDYDMELFKENNSNFIRWMHVAPKPPEVRSTDKYGIAIACPAGDKEGHGLSGRPWSQRAEAMRDAMIYFRNNPSVIFWETGNSAVSADQANEMAAIRDELDPHGMRFIGARSTTDSAQLNYDYNYAGTMIGADEGRAEKAKNAMAAINNYGPIMETEYSREESPRRVWDRYSPPDYDYVNKWLGANAKKTDGYDIHDLTQEEIVIKNVVEYAKYWSNRAGHGRSLFSAEAMMVWSDSNMHGRNSGTENCRTSGRVDPVRQKKEMFEGTKTAHSDGVPDVHIVGHWSYPKVSDDTYNYFDRSKSSTDTCYIYDMSKVLKRDPTTKTVYVIGSKDVSKVELWMVEAGAEKLLGTDEQAESRFIYQFDGIDVTKGDAVIAKAYNINGDKIAEDEIKRTGDAAELRLTPVTAPDGWRADGSDIAYFDVEVLDKDGNVCPLNYDKITLKGEGNGVLLGGYNSGMGAGCFQNIQASQGLSKYFGGDKDGKSTIGQNYVYAENGTNRIFVRSTRNAGDFKLTVSMEGAGQANITIESKPFELTGGLTKEMQSTKEPGVSAPVIKNKTNPMQPLMFAPKTLSWKDAITVKDAGDTTDYYDIYFGETKLEVADNIRARAGLNGYAFTPAVPVLEKLKSLGAPFTYSYDSSTATLTFTSGGNVYTVTKGSNFILTNGGDPTEINQEPEIIGDTLFISASYVLEGRIPGVSVVQDSVNKIVNITYTPFE